jgi:hypothetical protein
MNFKLAERMSNPSSDSISAPIYAESTVQPIREPPQLSNKKLQNMGTLPAYTIYGSPGSSGSGSQSQSDFEKTDSR